MAKTETKATPIRFKLFGETKGAVRYQEVDKDGKDTPADKIRIGTLYFRKSQFKTTSPVEYPEILSITVVAEEA